MSADLIPPYDEDAERAVIGACLIDQTAFHESANLLLPSDFYSGALSACYQAFVDVDKGGHPIDIVTTAARLRETNKLAQVGGTAALTDLLNATPNIANVMTHARVVRAKAVDRKAIVLVQRAAAELYQGAGDVNVTERLAGELSTLLDRQGAGAQASALECFGEFMATIDAAWDGSGFGCETGYRDVDRTIGSLRPKELSLIMGRPGTGKTALAGEVAMNVARGEARDGLRPCVLFFSLEMPRAQIVGRLACAAMGVNMTAVRIKNAVDDRVRLERARGIIEAANLYLDDRPALRFQQVYNTVRSFKRKQLAQGRHLHLVVVDYLQLMRGDERSHSRENDVSLISQGLKRIAKEFDVHVLALCQMNRDSEKRADKRPQLSDLRESGSLEQDADNVFGLYREDYYDERMLKNALSVVEFKVLKQRSGEMGTALLGFEKQYTRFRSLEPWEIDGYHPAQH